MKKEKQKSCPSVPSSSVFFPASLLLLAFLSLGVVADEGIKIGQSTAQAMLAHFGTASIIILFLLILLTSLLFNKTKSKANWLWAWGGVLLALVLAYSTLTFFAEGAEKGIVVCESAEKCLITMHIHSTMDISVCGEKKSIGLEEGELAATHTHKEGNYVHFHERLPYDPKTETILNMTALRVGNIFESEGIRFTQECLYDYCNGQSCPGKAQPGTVRMTVNGNESSQFQDYVWKDGDHITMRFE